MRRRILLLGVGMTSLVVLAFAIPLALLIRQNIENKALDSARYEAENLAYFISAQDPDGDQVSAYLDASGNRYPGTTWVQLSDGTIVGDPVPEELSEDDDDGDSDGDHDHDDDDIGRVSAASVSKVDGGALTSVQTITPQGPSTVHTFLSGDQLHDGQLAPLLALGGVSLALILISFGLGEALSRRLARPLEETAAAAARLAAGDTGARSPEDGPPEVAQVGRALNELAARIDEVIAAEREAVADLSHGLRTPLTALRLDVDAIADAETAARLGAHVSSLERTLTAIIHAARRPQREGRVPHAEAVSVVRDRAEFWRALAEDQDRRVSVRLLDHPEMVRASSEDLAVAVDALIENVIAHTAEGVGLDVAIDVDEETQLVVISIADNGPGIPLDAGRRGRSDRGSSGLGLDIARRCAELSGGSMTITRREGTGSLVELRLGRP